MSVSEGFQHGRNAIQMQCRGNVIGNGFEFWMAIVHGDAEADAFEHLHHVPQSPARDLLEVLAKMLMARSV